MSASLSTDVHTAIARGAEFLFSRQRSDGGFTFDSSAAATLATAGAIIALHCADPARFADRIATGAHWLRHTQRPDGGWAAVPDGPTEAVPTAVAPAALRIVAGQDADDQTVTTGLDRLRALGGLDAIPDPVVGGLCRMLHGLAGWADEGAARRLPLEIVLFPALRRKLISFRTAPFLGLALAQAHRRPPGALRRPLTRLAEPAAVRLLHEIHEDEGRTGEFSADAWAAGLLGIGLARAGVARDLVDAIADWLVSAGNPDGSWEAVRIGLTWTGFAATGLVDAGYAADTRLASTRDLIHASQQDRPFRAFDCPAGGWSFSGPRGWPVTLESAELLAALAGLSGHEHDEHLRRGAAWLAGRQDSRGSWSLWVRDTKLANDGPCPYLTAQAVEALLDAGTPASDPRVAKAVRWLVTQQRVDGSFEAKWYRDHTPGTALVLGALARCGLGAQPTAVRATAWLLDTQRADGSWSTGRAEDAGTVEETAWALRALLTAGVDPAGDPVRRAVAWLLRAQQPSGHWPEAPVSAYVRYCVHYPNGAITAGLALRALSRYRALAGQDES